MRKINKLTGIALSVVLTLSMLLSNEGLTYSVYADEIVEYENPAVVSELEEEQSSVEVADDEIISDETGAEELITENDAVADEAITEEIDEIIDDSEEIIIDSGENDDDVISSDGWGDESGRKYDNTIYDDLDYALEEMPIIEDLDIESTAEFAYDEAGEEMAYYEDAVAIPTSYPVTDKTGKTKDELVEELLAYADANYPQLRNQGSYGTCWAHASMAMAEISMIKKGKAEAATVDYSELALAYFMTHTVTDPLGGTEGDLNKDGPTSYGTHDWLINGGNTMYSSKILANWTGATSESKAPYSSAETAHSDGLASSLAFDDIAHMDGFAMTTASDRTGVKKLILENGAANVSYHAASSDRREVTSTYYNAANNCWFYPQSVGTNHSVTIVGWDDDFSKDNFNSVNGVKPAGNGAWLIRNSWYPGSGDKYTYRGYFWISYYDGNLNTVFSFSFDDADNYEHNYQMDGAAMSASLSDSNMAIFANVFDIKADEEGEELKAVSFCTNGVTNQQYNVDIYLNPKNGDPTDGTLMESATTSGSTTYAGYYTVPLTESVFVGPGDRVAVVITLKKSGYKPGISCENTSSGWLETETKALPYQSYVYDSDVDSWTDFGADRNRNIRIKAFTDKINPSDEWRTRKHNIIYKLNGGTNNSANPTFFRWTSPDITLEDPSRAGYIFDGWYKDAEFSEEFDMIESGSTEDVTVYAKWRVCYYSVKFNANGGSGTMDDMTNLKYSMSYNLSANKYTKKGYSFKSWNTKKDGSGKSYSNKASIKNLSNKNGSTVTLYAQWSIVKYTITYKLNGGKNNSKNPSTYKVNSNTITLQKPTRKGYKFIGWYKDSSYTRKGTQISTGSTGNKTYYAKWSKIKYTITYKLNGGKNNSGNPSAYTVTSSDITLKVPTRKGCSFRGWYSDSAYTKRVTLIEKGSTGNKTLYAKWSKSTYSITYYLYGGINFSSNPTSYNVDTSTITLKNPVRSGYSFAGWYTDSSFRNRITSIPKGSTGNKRLYAKWNQIYYTLRFSGNGATDGAMSDINGIAYEQVITLPSNKYTKTGYSFYGWNSKPDGSGMWVKNCQPIKGATELNGAVVMLYAIWQKV